MLDYSKQLDVLSFGQLGDLCMRAGLPKTYFYHMLREEWNPKAETLRKLCWALGLTVSGFLRLVEEECPPPVANLLHVNKLHPDINYRVFTYGYTHIGVKSLMIDNGIAPYRLPEHDRQILHSFMTDYKDRSQKDVTMYSIEQLAGIIHVKPYQLAENIEKIAAYDRMYNELDLFPHPFSYFKSLGF